MLDHREAFEQPLARPSATPDPKAKAASPIEEIPPKPPWLRERTRAENSDRYRRSPMRLLESEFRCECGRTDCRVTLPLEVDPLRRRRDRFIVGLNHADGDTVVGVADHFLVVEAKVVAPSPRRPPDRAADPRAGGEANHVVSIRRPGVNDVAVSEESRPTLIFFTRETSGPARRMDSLLAHVAFKERERLRVRHVDVANHTRLAREFGVEEVPCLVLVVERKIAGRIDGRANMTQINLLLEQLA